MTAELHEPIDSPWTPEETTAIRDGLESAVQRLRAELILLDHDDPGSLTDDLDIASERSGRLQDAVQAENTAAILEQTQHVLDRLNAGQYGVCEACSTMIARPRLEAFPRATLCIRCAS